MATFYIQLQDKLLQISGELTAENISKALGYVPVDSSIMSNYATKDEISDLVDRSMVEELSQRVDNITFDSLKGNPFLSDGSGELNIVDEVGNIIAKIDAYGIHSVDFIAGNHKLTDKIDSSALNGYATEEWVENKNYLTEHQDISHLATKEEVSNIDFYNINNNPIVNNGDGKLLFVDENGYIGLQLEEAGLYVKDVIADRHTLSQKADKSDIPSLDGYATESYVNTNLQNYATKDEVSDLVDMSVVTELQGKVNTLIDTDADKSVRDIAVDALTETLVSETATEAYDTLAEMSAWIKSHPEDVSAMNTAIQKNATDVQSNTTAITNLDAAYKAADAKVLTDANEYTDNINFYTIKDNPIVDGETGSLTFVDLTGYIGLKVTEDGIIAKDFVTSEHALSNKADKSFVEDNYYNKSTVDKKITKAVTDSQVNLDGYATEQWVNELEFLKEHQDISHLATKLEIPSIAGLVKEEDLPDFNTFAKTSDIPKLDGYATQIWVGNLNFATKTLLADKVDKISGKQLSTEDFTTALKTKLNSLSNYDDAEINNLITTLRNDFNTLVSGDTSKAIKSFNDIIAFLENIEDSENLDSIIASIELQILNNKNELATVATTGSYNDLVNKPEIPNETIISNWGFAKSSALQTKAEDSSVVHKTGNETIAGAKTFNGGVNFLGNGDSNAVTLSTNTKINVNGTNKTVLGFGSGTFYINHGDYKLLLRGKDTRPTYNSTTLALSSDISGKQDKLVSGTNIKTINGESIIGEGDIVISVGSESTSIDWENIQNKPYVVTIDSSTFTTSDIYNIKRGHVTYKFTPGKLIIDDVTGDDSCSIKGHGDLTFNCKGDGTKFLSDDGNYKEISGNGADLSNYATKEELNIKLDNIADLETIRTNANIGANSYIWSILEDIFEYVDLGLPSGTLWATHNIGATKPEEYGDYYAWGETEEKSNYSWDTYKWCNGSPNTLTKYCTASSRGKVDNKIILEPSDDVAHVKLGGSWRMPTLEEQLELRNECAWQWTELNGVNGYRVTGPNGNSIFLPASGYRSGAELNYRESYGYYWVGSLYNNDCIQANCVYLSFSVQYKITHNRSYGCSVRPVCRLNTAFSVEGETLIISNASCSNDTIEIYEKGAIVDNKMLIL